MNPASIGSTIWTGIRSAGPAIVFAWRYKADLYDLGKALYGLYDTFKRKMEKWSRDEKVDDAQAKKNPDALENSFRTGGGGT